MRRSQNALRTPKTSSSGVLGAAFLLLQVALVLAMIYVGWRWLDNGEFSLRGRGDYI